MKTLYMVRHGEVENPEHLFYSAEFPLSKNGLQVITELAACLPEAGCRPQQISCSPHKRTRESAGIIGKALGIEPHIDERLAEWKVGDWIGKPLAEFREAAGYNQRPFHLRLSGVEQYADAAARIQACANDLLGSLEDGACTMIVSHREPMVAAILAWQGDKDWSRIPELDFPPGACWKLDFEADSGALQNAARFDTLCRQQKTGV